MEKKESKKVKDIKNPTFGTKKLETSKNIIHRKNNQERNKIKKIQPLRLKNLKLQQIQIIKKINLFLGGSNYYLYKLDYQISG